MLYLDWRFTLIALSVAPILFGVVYSYTRRIKRASRAMRQQEGQITSVVEEVLSSIRVVKAFAREDYEVKRLEEESLEGVELALRARSLKAKLTPIVDLVVAIGDLPGMQKLRHARQRTVRASAWNRRRGRTSLKTGQ